MTSAASAVLIVHQPGLGTSVQDLGRPGFQRLGVPVSGALDRTAHVAANVVAGNPGSAATLECLYRGPELEVAAESVRLAVAGAGAAIEIAAEAGEAPRRVPALQSVTVTRGQRITVRIAGPSISAYLAAEGGIDVPPMLGSRSTYVRAALGGLEGRLLRHGDVVPLARDAADARQEVRLPDVDLAPALEARIVLGPQDDRFTAEAIETIALATYTVSPASDRMGLRLEGPLLAHTHGADIVSDGIAPGAIQVPGSGQPIIMLADRQTTGGYTKIATVASADLPALGRVGPGTRLRLHIVSVGAAEAAARALAEEMAGWPARLAPVSPSPEQIAAALWGANLVSGIVDAHGGWCGACTRAHTRPPA